MKTYYIVYETENKKSWRIFSTKHDLDTSEGFINWITEKEEEENENYVVYYWKELK